MEEQKKENKKENKKEKIAILLLLILIALIIIIFLLIKNLGIIDNKDKMPTGNVDIFDIIFGTGMNCTSCNCGCNGNSKQQCGCNSPDCICNSTNLPLTDEESTTNSYKAGSNVANGIQIYDNDTKFSANTELNIFKQKSYHVLKDKIAPSSENSYQFVIRNNNNFNIRYDLQMTEQNAYNINMRYRLKLNGKYVVGNNNEYVTVEELNRYNIGLVNNAYDVYTLDWKWIESDNDTEIGENIEAYYKLNLKITATQD